MSVTTDLQKQTTDYIIKGLEEGVAPWGREWEDDGTSNPIVLRPRIGKSQRP